MPAGAASPATTSESYDALRLALGVAEGGELAGELPLELNLDGLNAVSFAKGCYVGQELTSRTHFRGVVRKRAMPVTLAASPSQLVAAGAQLLPAEGGTAVGRLLASRGVRGVALLRLAGALPSAPGAPPPTLALEGGGGTAVPQRPRWWPHAWGTEG